MFWKACESQLQTPVQPKILSLHDLVKTYSLCLKFFYFFLLEIGRKVETVHTNLVLVKDFISGAGFSTFFSYMLRSSERKITTNKKTHQKLITHSYHSCSS